MSSVFSYLFIVVLVVFRVIIAQANPKSKTPMGETKIYWWDEAKKEYRLNEGYLKNVTEPIKAILAFYSAQAGTQCRTREVDDSLKGLACELTEKLGIDIQCSKEHLGLIKKWFRFDVISQNPQSCYRPSSEVKNQRNLLFLSLQIEQDTVAIHYSMSHVDLEEMESIRKEGKDVFKIYPDSVKMVATHTVQKREEFGSSPIEL